MILIAINDCYLLFYFIIKPIVGKVWSEVPTAVTYFNNTDKKVAPLKEKAKDIKDK